jgi:hypothetical protein
MRHIPNWTGSSSQRGRDCPLALRNRWSCGVAVGAMWLTNSAGQFAAVSLVSLMAWESGVDLRAERKHILPELSCAFLSRCQREYACMLFVSHSPVLKSFWLDAMHVCFRVSQELVLLQHQHASSCIQQSEAERKAAMQDTPVDHALGYAEFRFPGKDGVDALTA